MAFQRAKAALSAYKNIFMCRRWLCRLHILDAASQRGMTVTESLGCL